MKIAPYSYHAQAVFRCLLVVPLILAGLISFQAVQAQNGETQLNDTTKTATAFLDVSDMAEFGQVTSQLIQNTTELLVSRAELTSLQKNLTELHPRLDRKLIALTDTTIIIRFDKLDKEEREMNLLIQRTDEWDTRIVDWLGRSTEADAQISIHLNTWEATRDSLSVAFQADSVGAATDTDTIIVDRRLLESAETYVADLTSLDTDLDAWAMQLSSIQAEMTLVKSKLETIKVSMINEKREIRSKFWLPGYPPIWRMLKEPETGLISPMIWDRIDRDLDIISDYYQNNRQLPYYLAFFFLMIFGILIYLKVQGNKYYDSFEEELASARIVLRYPFLSALLLTCIWAILFSHTPSELNRFIWPVLILPFAFMLRKLNPNWKADRMVIFILLYLIFFILPALNEVPFTQRIFLLCMNTGLLGIVIWFRRRRSEDVEMNKWWFGMLPFLANLFIFVCAVALIANVIGNLQLAQLLTYTIIGTFLTFILLRVLIELTSSLVLVILLGPLHNVSNIIKEDSALIMRKFRKLLIAVAVLFWLISIMDLLTVKASVRDALISFFTYRIEIGEMGFSLWNVIAFFLILQIAVWLSALIRYVLDKEVFPRTKVKEGTPGTVFVLVRFTVITLGFLLALAGAGIKVSQISIAVGALGVGIGFGLRDVVNNFISGIILAIERPIGIGDIVKVGEVFGTVRDIGLRASQIRTWEGSDVMVPNGDLIANQVTNWTLKDRRRRITINVRVTFDTDMEAVSELLINAALEVPGVLKRPTPFIHLEGIGDSAMEIKLYAWISNIMEFFEKGTAIRMHVYDRLQKAGYEIPVKRVRVETNKDGELSSDKKGHVKNEED